MEYVYGKVSASKKAALEIFKKELNDIVGKTRDLFNADDLVYFGYPIIKSADGNDALDALLLSAQYGVIAFDVMADGSTALAARRQDEIYGQLVALFSGHPELMEKRALKFNIYTISLDFFNTASVEDIPDDFQIAKKGPDIKRLFEEFQKKNIDSIVLRKLKSVLQAIYELKPLKKRTGAKTAGSKGTILKELEKQIANLDIYQNKAIIEITQSPQRIIGLAGTGKTIVLAGKAAYLHAIDPEQKIAVVFYSRSLHQQYRELIRRLYFALTKDEPNWEKIQILQAWGGNFSDGFYYNICKENKMDPLTFKGAVQKFGSYDCFSDVCDELLKKLEKPLPVYDVILIDEAQDLPRSFFEICYISTPPPHRVVWAYDELQQLSKIETVEPPELLFGKNENGTPRFKFSENVDGPDDNIVLKVCYRSPKEIITAAHALGLAVYSESGPIQMIEDRGIWERIGYDVTGDFSPGEKIELKRNEVASPKFVSELLQNDEIVKAMEFQNPEEQAEWIASEIENNLKTDELEHTDILVIFPEPYTMKSSSSLLRIKLVGRGIENHLAGDADASQFYVNGSIAISHIFRAKGNETAIVYIADAQACAAGSELIRKRNILFTAMSRSRAWVRVCGYGSKMANIAHELALIKENGYKLVFTYPSDLETRRKLHRELSEGERQKKTQRAKDAQRFAKSLTAGDINPDDIPDKVREDILKYLRRSK